MLRQALITRGEVRFYAVLALVLVLLAAAMNVPVALILSKEKRFMPPPRSGVRAAPVLRSWPASTPHDRPWPAPQSWDEARGFGWRYYNVITPPAQQGRNGFQMTVKLSGWPLPVLEDKQMWWDWADPTLAGPVSDPAMSLRPAGLVLNPVIVGGLVFLATAGTRVVLVVGRRAVRRRRNRCVGCGYPLGTSAVCTECGAPLPAVL